MLKPAIELAGIEVKFRRLISGVLLAYITLLGLMLLVLIYGLAIGDPSASKTNFQQTVSGVLFFALVGFPFVFFALSGPVVALALFLVSILQLVLKRLNILMILSCFAAAATLTYSFAPDLSSYQQLGHPRLLQFPSNVTNHSNDDYFHSVALITFFNSFILVFTSFYIYFDPFYRNKNETG